MDDLFSIAVSNAVAATVLALAAIVVGAVYRRPALVHGMWLLVLLKLVTPPLVYIPVSWPAAAEAPAEISSAREVAAIAVSGESGEARSTQQGRQGLQGLQGQEEPVGVVELPERAEGSLVVEVPSVAEEPSHPFPAASLDLSLWPEILRFIWGVGALSWFLLVVERMHHFRRLLRFARPAPAWLQERARLLAQPLGLKRCPRVRLLPGRIAPMLWAAGGPPRLLVPAELIHALNEEQLDTLLVHELAHLRRRDHWVRLLEFVVLGLYWWHPVVWYARRELREAEEQCCDAWVVSTLPGAGRTYASALVETLDFLSTTPEAVPPLASGLGQIADLKRRLTMIMQGNTPRSLTWPGCLAVVTLGLTFLPMLPSLHGEPPTKEEVREQIQQAERELDRAKEALDRQKEVLDRQKEVLNRQKAELRTKVKELAKSEQQRATETKRKDLVQLREHRDLVVIGDGKKGTSSIVITISADPGIKANQLNDIIEQIRKSLPEKLHANINLQVGPESGFRFRMTPGVAPPAPAARPVPGATPAPPGPPAPPSPPAARGRAARSVPPGNPNVPMSKASEKRIDNLEKRLDKMLDELHELRKQLKESRREVQ